MINKRKKRRRRRGVENYLCHHTNILRIYKQVLRRQELVDRTSVKI
jgi:hypothetical protein